MNCFRCHTPIPDTSRYCLSCGALVSDPTGAAVTTAEMDETASRELEVLVRNEVGTEFEIVRELGRGGMAIVYLANEVHLGRQVALKVLPPELTFGKGAIERFKREARTAATLDHPNIIPIYRVTPGGKLFWYAMKYLEGRTLADLFDEKKRLPLADALPILESIAAALDYAHRRKVVHRDIKPANVMIDPENRVILTDFGIAKELSAGSLTASGSVLGTPVYMSPEQCTGGELSGASDQYSVGIMTYQMLSGQVPFDSNSIPDLLHKHCLEPPPPLDVLRPGLPPFVYGAVNKALAKKPGDRFTTVGAFVQALKRPSAEIVTAEAPRRPSLWRRISTASVVPAWGSSDRRRLIGVVLAAVTIGVIGGSAWLLTRPEKAQPPTALATLTDTLRNRPSPPEPSVAPLPTGRLTITGLPSGGTTTVDGQPRVGTTFELDAGRHFLRLQAPGFETTVDTLLVGSGAVLPHRFAGRRMTAPGERAAVAQPQPQAPLTAAQQVPPQPSVLVIQTVGGWARISVDGAFRREGTSHRDTVPSGAHALRFERDGWVTVDTSVTLRAGVTNLVRVVMRRTP